MPMAWLTVGAIHESSSSISVASTAATSGRPTPTRRTPSPGRCRCCESRCLQRVRWRGPTGSGRRCARRSPAQWRRRRHAGARTRSPGWGRLARGTPGPVVTSPVDVGHGYDLVETAQRDLKRDPLRPGTEPAGVEVIATRLGSLTAKIAHFLQEDSISVTILSLKLNCLRATVKRSLSRTRRCHGQEQTI